MSIETMKQNIEALRAVLCDPEAKCCIQGSAQDLLLVDAALAGLDQAIAELDKQEPVSIVTSKTGDPSVTMSWQHEPALPVGIKLYTSPKPRAWPAWMQGVRVEDDKVVIATKDNNTARALCAELLKEKT